MVGRILDGEFRHLAYAAHVIELSGRAARGACPPFRLVEVRIHFVDVFGLRHFLSVLGELRRALQGLFVRPDYERSTRLHRRFDSASGFIVFCGGLLALCRQAEQHRRHRHHVALASALEIQAEIQNPPAFHVEDSLFDLSDVLASLRHHVAVDKRGRRHGSAEAMLAGDLVRLRLCDREAERGGRKRCDCG